MNQLPLAVFGIAMGVVLLPALSKAIKENNQADIAMTQNRSLEFCLLISLPSAVGLFILSAPIIHIMFERGAFLATDTFYTAKVLSIFALGLPAYILIKVLVVCFFAREDTRTPLYISVICVLINIAVSLALIGFLREMGIAVATAVSAWINAFLLYIVLRTRNNILLDTRTIQNSIKIIIATILMLIACYFLNVMFFANLAFTNILTNLGLLFLIIILCKIIYIGTIFMLKVLTIDELKGYIKN